MKSNLNKASWKLFFIRIILPSLLSISLFILTIFIIIIPRFEENIMAYKREMIKELTNSAWSILAQYEEDEKNEVLSREEAQKIAISNIEFLRYGEANKDYFWITDMHPKMIMHPYLTYLDDHDLSDFKDPHGKRMFVEFVKAVRENGHGYVDYMWQYKDDSTHIVPKISYVRSFEPWGWIIGTGVYVEDVKKEISSLTGKLIKISIGITLFIILLLVINTHQSVVIERRRIRAELQLKESQERYKALVEAATEGLIMLVDGFITHSNKTFSDFIGYSKEELLGKNFVEFLGADHKLEPKLFNDKNFLKDGQFEITLNHRDGNKMDLLLIISSVSYSETPANIIIVKDISINENLSLTSVDYDRLIDNLNLGVFRTTVDLKGRFITANQAAIHIFGFNSLKELSEVYILELFDDIADKRFFRKQLLTDGFIKNRIMNITHKDGNSRFISLSLLVKNNEDNAPLYCDGVVEDVTDQFLYKEHSEKTINEFQNSWLFLEQNICQFLQKPVLTEMTLPINKLSEKIIENKTDYAILTFNNEAVGIVTIDDLNTRCIAERRDVQTNAYEIMSSPLVYTAIDFTLKDAIRFANKKSISHILIKNNEGIVGVLNRNTISEEISRSINYLTDSLDKAETLNELIYQYKKLSISIKPFIESGVNAKYISKKVTEFSDVITKKVVEMAIRQLGEPPVKFAFIILGSVGRCEQTLATDQDNAIIYENVTKENEEVVAQYFKKLSELVCDNLNAIGYCYCKGNNMASNPKWCQPYSMWEKYFANWIMTPDAKNLLDISIFFDFRTVYGDITFTDQLRQFINRIIENKTAFFYNLIDNINSFKVTISSASTINDPKSGGELYDIKKPIAIMVMFARIYAIYNKINATNTIYRIEALKDSHIFNNQLRDELLYAYNYLMQLRLKHQISLMSSGLEPDNLINLKNLQETELLVLKKIISQISSYQSKLNLDFKGHTV